MDKQSEIVNAAIDRFSVFGIAKTTLGQIATASETRLSVIYQHFANKECLVVAALNKLYADYERMLKRIFIAEDSLHTNLKRFILLRHEYIQKYFNLNLWQDKVNLPYGGQDAQICKRILKNGEIKHIEHILQFAIDSKEIKPINVLKSAMLFISTITGLMLSNIYSENYIPESAEAFSIILDDQLAFLEIFISGLLLAQ
jgi:TetR/AcrR family transcriptional regulator